MNRIITIGREFGSGGRELGKRLAEALNFAYYDQEIVSEIAQRTALSESYVKQIMEHKPPMPYPIRIGATLHISTYSVHEQTNAILRERSAIIREMAEASDCVIVGRCADSILREMHPFRIFVYANMEQKITRCRQKGEEPENMTDKELEKHILGVDRQRAAYYEPLTGQKWGDRRNYDLCVNTTAISPKEYSGEIAALIKKRFDSNDC